MVAHDIAKAPLSDEIVFVENVTKMRPGEGLWKSIVKGPSSFAIHVPDEVNQTAGYLAMMTYMAPPPAPPGASPEQRAEVAAKPPVEQPVIVAIRLKFDPRGRIVQAEHLLSGVREAQMANLQSPRPGIFTEIPTAERKSHDELIKIGASYYDALDDNNGELRAFRARLRAPRERHDHRERQALYRAARSGCGRDASSGARLPWAARQQYVPVHRQDREPPGVCRRSADGPRDGPLALPSPDEQPAVQGESARRVRDRAQREEHAVCTFDLPAAHIFKVGPDGQIHEIEAMGFTAPYNSPTGWE